MYFLINHMIQHQFTSKTKVEEITKGKAQKSETTHRIRFESHYKVVSGPDSLRGNTEPSFCQTYKYSFSLSHTDTDTVILAQWQKLVDRESRHSAPSEQCAIVGLSEVRSRRGRGGGGGRGLSTTLEGERDRSRGMKRKREGRAEIGKGGRKRGKNRGNSEIVSEKRGYTDDEMGGWRKHQWWRVGIL